MTHYSDLFGRRTFRATKTKSLDTPKNMDVLMFGDFRVSFSKIGEILQVPFVFFSGGTIKSFQATISRKKNTSPLLLASEFAWTLDQKKTHDRLIIRTQGEGGRVDGG